MNASSQRRGGIGSGVGIGFAALCLVIGYPVADAHRAVTDGIGSAKLADFTTTTSGDGVFNWLLFAPFAGAAAICLTIGIVTDILVSELRASRRNEPSR